MNHVNKENMNNHSITELRILVLGVGGNVSQGIIKALRSINTIRIIIYGVCIDSLSVGLYMCDHSEIAPLASDKGFIYWYLDFCNTNRIDMAFTGVEENIDILIQNRHLLESKTNTIFVFPTEESWKLGNDKYLLVQWLKKNSCNYPESCCTNDITAAIQFLEAHGNMIVAKPRHGKSSAGVIIVRDKETIVGMSELDQYVLQEYIGSEDDEYTVGCYFDREGRLRGHIVMHRYLKNGGTSICEIVQNESIDKEILKIARRINAIGPLNIQLRIDANMQPVCFEWNVRYSGTTAIRNHFGFKDVEAALREYILEKDIDTCFRNVDTKGTAVRFDNEMYFDGISFADLRSQFWNK